MLILGPDQDNMNINYLDKLQRKMNFIKVQKLQLVIKQKQKQKDFG